MNIFSILYTICIEPIKLLFEVIFGLCLKITDSSGLSIIFLSLIMNFLLLPLYNRADKIQEEEKNIENKLKPGIDHIKKHFKGDEQYMLIQTYYRQNNYKPYYSLKGLLPLLLEIPFFMAAYSFISNLGKFDGCGFGIISDLSLPDNLLLRINILPILMTIINIVSSSIYTKGDSLKAKIQLYGMALIFLVLLYNSPSALSLYYLLNNIFSLFKNIFLKLKHKDVIISLALICIGIVGLCTFLFVVPLTSAMKILMTVFFLLVTLFGLIRLLGKNSHFVKFPIRKDKSSVFILTIIMLSVLLGLYIPSQLISSSPEEFLDLTTLINPVFYIFNSFALAVGFSLWVSIYYLMVNEDIKNILSFCTSALCIIGTVNFLFFDTNLGTLTNTLILSREIEASLLKVLINIVVFAMIILVLLLVWNKKIKYSKLVLIAVCVSMFTMSASNIVKTNKTIASVKERTNTLNNTDVNLTLSKSGKNVIVIMLDRAISAYFPYIFEEIPELQEQFSGFTYYPNAVSFGGHTNISTPSLFGGYEYTPIELNKRDTELLVDKHNEALLVMPVLFSQNDFNVIVCDPPYAGYNEIPDLSIYNDYPNINAYITEGMFGDENGLNTLNKKLFCYSIFKISPSFLKQTIYDSGNYMLIKDKKGNTKFMEQYKVLTNLNDLTTIVDNQKGSFILFQNGTTHEPILIEETNYDPFSEENNELLYDGQERTKKLASGDSMSLSTYEQLSHYDVNAAALKQIGKYIDYLKEQNVYDNTRIIVVSDHGYTLEQFENFSLNNRDLMMYNPLLLVKDFDTKEYKVDASLMTLADIPYISFNGVIENPANPFTGIAIEKEEKDDKEYNIFITDEYDIRINNKTTFIEGDWFTVKNNCLELSNWSQNDN